MLRFLKTIAMGLGAIAASAVWANQPQVDVAACKLSLQDMLRQPKDKSLVMTETMMNCGRHGQHSLEAFYGQGWRLVQVISDEGVGARVAIFERGRQ